jgi:hypothetical protein
MPETISSLSLKMEDKPIEMQSLAVVELPSVNSKENTNRDQQEMSYFGKAQQLKAGSLQYQLHLALSLLSIYQIQPHLVRFVDVK